MEYLYGRNAVAEAFTAQRRRVARLIVADGARGLEGHLAIARQHGIPTDVTARERMDRLVQGAHHQGIIAEVGPYRYVRLQEILTADNPLMLVLDSLKDPQNFGTLLRTAQATGVSGVVIPEHRAVAVTAAVSSASAGAVEHLRIARVTNLARALQAMQSDDVWVYGLVVDASQSYWQVDWRGGAAIVIGSEGSGLSRIVRERCDALVTIPMAPDAVQSLNAATAGSIVLYEAFRQRSATLA